MSISGISHSYNRYAAFATKLMHSERQAMRTSDTDTTSISPEAKVALAEENRVTGKGRLDLPPISLDPVTAQANVEARVKELFKELGIPESTPVTMAIGPKGELQVDIDHPRGDELEKRFADDRQLRNEVNRLHGTMALQRIAKAAHQVWNNAGNDYVSRTNAVNWMKNFTADTYNMPFSLRYDGSTMQAGFEDGKGNLVDYMNNFTVPKTFA